MMKSSQLIFIVVFSLIALIINVNAFQFPDCQNGPLMNFPICNPSLSESVRANDLVSRLNLSEKINNLGHVAAGSARLGLPGYTWWSEALHGVAGSPGVNFQYPLGVPFSSATSFPMPIGVGASFNDDLVLHIGDVVSTEARAFSNHGFAGLDFWTPNINPFRDPRWGRGQETPGEDPFRLGSYARSLLTGLQKGAPDTINSKYVKVTATCKHYAAYDLEQWNNTDRHHFNAIVTPQDVSDYYLVPFEACVLDAKAESIMCSYNEINGVPACGNSFYLQTLLREEMRFDGYVVSDCDAIEDIYDRHHYTQTGEQATALGLKSGTDLDCGGTYSTFAQNAINQGLLSEAEIDLALRRHFIGLLRLGYFDNPVAQPFRQLGIESVNTIHAQDLALDAACQSAVLLKNDNNVLPLPASTPGNPISIALIGPSVNVTELLLGNYFGTPPYISNPLHAFINTTYIINYVHGCDINSSDKSQFAEAIAAAQKSQYIIYIGGLDQNQEAEGLDRTSITWPGVQEELISQLSAVGKPFVLVVLSGGQIDLINERDNKNVDSIVWFGYPGQAGGWAIVDVLTGAYGPAGKLPVTQYPGSYTQDVSMFDMRLPANSKYPGRTHRWYTGRPTYSFGHGLTYSTFQWQVNPSYPQGLDSSFMNLTSGIPTFTISDLIEYVTSFDPLRPDRVLLPITWHIEVTNVGTVVSDIVTLAYISNLEPAFQAPLRQLWSYSRHIHVAPKETRYSDFTLNIHELSSVDYAGVRYLTPGTYELYLNNDRDVSIKIQLTGLTQSFYTFPTDPATEQKVKAF